MQAITAAGVLLLVSLTTVAGMSMVARYWMHQYDVSNNPKAGPLHLNWDDFGIDSKQSLLLLQIDPVDGMSGDTEIDLRMGESVFRIYGPDAGQKHVAFFILSRANNGQLLTATVLKSFEGTPITTFQILGQTSTRIDQLLSSADNPQADGSYIQLDIPVSMENTKVITLKGTLRHLSGSHVRNQFWTSISKKVFSQNPGVGEVPMLLRRVLEAGKPSDADESQNSLWQQISTHSDQANGPVTDNGLAEFLTTKAHDVDLADAIHVKECPYIESCNGRRFHDVFDSQWQKLSWNPILQCMICHHLQERDARLPTILDAIQPEAALSSSPANAFFHAIIRSQDAHRRIKRLHHPHVKVVNRQTGQEFEEKIAGYIRVGLDLFFGHGLSAGDTFIGRFAMKKMSEDYGHNYSKTDEKKKNKQIDKFMSDYPGDIKMSDFTPEDPHAYKSMNEFFARPIKMNLRPIQGGQHEAVCAADCRLMVFPTVQESTQFWIKGKQFSLLKMLGNDQQLANHLSEGSMAIFRLAPQDYHRFHSPVNARIVSIKHVGGDLFSVNPICINSNVDVFGRNKRTVMHMESKEFGHVAYVMVSAMLVGSLELSVKEGDYVERGREIGFFKFGGSTIVTVFQKGKIRFSPDLLVNSLQRKLETAVQMGQRLGHCIGCPGEPAGMLPMHKGEVQYTL